MNNSLKKFMQDKYLSENTIKSYSDNISAFILWCNIKKIKIKELKALEIGEYKKYLLEEKKVSIRSVAAYFNAIKLFLKFIYCTYGTATPITVINDQNKFVRINMPKITYKIKDVNYSKELSVKEVNRLLLAAKERSERDYLIILTMCTTGMRVSEVLSLKCYQLNKSNFEVTLKGKTRSLILPPKIRTKIVNYINGKSDNDYIFTHAKKQKPLSRKTVFSFIKKYGSKANIKKDKCFPHNLRKHYTVNEIMIGTDIQTIADELGHRNLDVLRVYKERSLESKRKRMERIARKYK